MEQESRRRGKRAGQDQGHRTGARFGLLLLGAGVMSACGSSAPFAVSDMSRIALQASEAPSGTLYSEMHSGPKPPKEFLEPFDEESRAFLRRAGLEMTYQSAFGPPEVVKEEVEGPEQLSAETRLVFSQLLLFAEARGAIEWLEDLMADVRGRKSTVELAADGLGEQSFGFRTGNVLSAFLRESIFYAWRVRNLGLVLIVEGGFDEQEARGLADRMNSRAS